jgi:hypothetical protein
MRPSRLVFAGAAVFALAACDVLLGLGNYSDGDAMPDAHEAQAEAGMDGTADVYEASVDAHADADADAEAGVQANDGGIDGPTLVQRWAQWPMPNPDASIGGDSSVLLPNTMWYDAAFAWDAADAGLTVTDEVTQLVWQRDGSHPAATLADAQRYCAENGWRLPTRIELVSIIDFTQIPTIDGTAFPNTPKQAYWTSSIHPPTGESWSVDFSDGTVSHGASPIFVRCVSGGSP